jgi:LDH2 family malate/lactate/ureidoglycolate dehydrogenase
MTGTPGRVLLAVPDARALALASLQGIGYDATDASIITDHVIEAALCGYEYSGLPKILNVAENPRQRGPRGPMRIEHETPVSRRYDAGNLNGMVAIHHATDAAIEKAQDAGIAVVGVRNSWTSGRGAHFVERIARAGLIGVHTVRSLAQVAPLGGARAALGTNPMSFGFPTEDEPLLVDVGTSAVMFTDLALRARRGETLPEGVAIDAEGRPTRDPRAAQLGAALPFGGHKGFALAMAVHALGVFAGATGEGDQGYGYLILAMQPELLLPSAEYRRRLSQSLADIKATPMADGVHEITLPGERSRRHRERALRVGIEIDDHIHRALTALAARAEAPSPRPKGPMP